MNSSSYFVFIEISSMISSSSQIAAVVDFLDFASKLKGERGVALSQHIMFNFKHIYSRGGTHDSSSLYMLEQIGHMHPI